MLRSPTPLRLGGQLEPSVDGAKSTVAKGRGRADRQLLARLVVNHHPAAPRDEYDLLRVILHNATRTGLAAQNRTDHPDFAQYLVGGVPWVGHHHPARAAKLATLLAHAVAAPETDAARQLRRI